jgi:hypothetical protein
MDWFFEVDMHRYFGVRNSCICEADTRLKAAGGGCDLSEDDVEQASP